MTGRNIATPYWNVYFPQECLLKWDGKRDNGNEARIGIYIVKISSKDPSSSKVLGNVENCWFSKAVVVSLS